MALMKVIERSVTESEENEVDIGDVCVNIDTIKRTQRDINLDIKDKPSVWDFY